MSRRKSVWTIIIAVALALAGLGREYLSPDTGPNNGSGPATAAIEIGLAELPPEARTVLAQIRAGGPFQYDKDGSRFGNREGLLPKRGSGYYAEYTVPTPGASNRGARRLVTGGDKRRDPDQIYYTADHYRSFKRVRE